MALLEPHQSDVAIVEASAANEPALPAARFRHVLVPLDGTRQALAALPTARVLAARFGAELHTITIRSDHAEVHLLQDAGTTAAVGRVHVAGRATPAESIARYAADLGSCVVCMSTAGRGRVFGSVLRSVTSSVLSLVGPIIAVGPVGDRPTWLTKNGQRRGPAPLSTQSLVACVDGSVQSEAVLPAAAAWATALDMQLSILMFTTAGGGPMRSIVRARDTRLVDDPSEYVQQLASRWHGAAPAVSALALPEPIGLAGGLHAYLGQNPTGLIAVSTQARSGLHRLLHGAAADKILRMSPVPCLVVPQRAPLNSAMKTTSDVATKLD